MHRAAESGQISELALLIKKGELVDVVDEENSTPLHKAVLGIFVLFFYVFFLRVLEIFGLFCIYLYCIIYFFSVLFSLWFYVRQTNKQTNTKRRKTANQPDAVKFLLESGAKVNAQGFLFIYAFIHLLIYGFIYLFLSLFISLLLFFLFYIYLFTYFFVYLFIVNISNLDANGDTALHKAAASSNYKCSYVLTTAGADSNLKNNQGLFTSFCFMCLFVLLCFVLFLCFFFVFVFLLLFIINVLMY
jgi:ankyrin repeat protein